MREIRDRIDSFKGNNEYLHDADTDENGNNCSGKGNGKCNDK